jgi:phage virion morphogenesis protein
MATKIKFQVNDAGARAKLKALIAASGDLKPVFATVGRVIVNRIRLCFKLGIDPWGTPWAALKFRKGQPLRDTGRLQRSIVANPDKDGVTIGTNVKYARTHQFGATITPKSAKRLVFPGAGGQLIFAKKVTVPSRPFMPLKKDQQAVALPPDWSTDMTRALRAYFKKAAEKAS